ncbi:bifunctional phosphoribosyl-AMP cyclohydrolase/phosphoribosyl-ATP diphosphatase HisIE [Aequorivita sp. Q41]|uniref:bifunctional phosphoribosyl-AMP cyclohydrolase/phosphoribosyl-ATP diphosphatase HisIE n=1 Tax=Aequorivita sp. Q41 TaxID=3153300 RepID=UPI003241EF6A
MKIDFNKYSDGLVPAIIQDNTTGIVLMLGYMNQKAFLKTNETNVVTFFSRSKQRLWTKGEESGNFLKVISMRIDCDNDALLVKANPVGPVCHKGFDTCWEEKNMSNFGFLLELETIIEDRKKDVANEDSYISSLFRKGINKIAQKVGEEAVEVVIEAKDNDDKLFLNESADLLFHYMILLQAKGFKLQDIENVLELRHNAE